MDYREKLIEYGEDIITSNNMNIEKKCLQHGKITVYEHSINVAIVALILAERMSISVDERSMVRGALLHDYCLYDWHDKNNGVKLHGWKHPKIALDNALKEFELNEIEQDVICRHMFPFTITPPKHKEGWLVTMADKICAVYETVPIPSMLKVEELYG